MSLNIVIDMNLSPAWVPFLQGHGWPAIHWSQVGDRRATDREIMNWALATRTWSSRTTWTLELSWR
jgi:predicted nuclease of predicted toxin-antitoxin system